MGNTQSQAKTNQVLGRYTFLRRIDEGRNLYKRNIDSKQFVTVQRIFPSQELIFQYQKNIIKLLKIHHPYFLSQAEHAIVTSSTICSMQHRVVHLFQYQPHTLQQELETRRLHQRFFQQKQVWSILCSCVLAMAHLTKNELIYSSLHPKNILIDKFGMIKIMSPLLSENGNDQIVDEAFYYSPEHFKAFKLSNFSQISNKSSVFTLGVTLLHILCLQPMNELYNYQDYTINMDLLNQLVEKISQHEIKDIIRKMLKYHGYDRITFTELEEMLYNVLEGQQEKQVNSSGQNLNTSALKAEEILGQKDSQGQKLKDSIYRVQKTSDPNLMMEKNADYMTDSNASQFSADPCFRPNKKGQKDNLSKDNPARESFPDLQDEPSQKSILLPIEMQNIDEQDIIDSIHIARQHQSRIIPNKKSSNVGYKITWQQNNLNSTSTLNTLQQKSQNLLFTNGRQSKVQDLDKITDHSNSFRFQQGKSYHLREQMARGVYEGYKFNKMRHGYGVFYYAEGGKYAGQWVMNKMQGRGALYYANQNIAYEGEWKNDKLSGYGILYNQTPEYNDSPLDFRSLHLLDNNWTKYEGNFVQDQKNGNGTLYFSNEQYFRGSFKDDLPHGNGVYKCLNGNFIKGNWIFGMMQ